jgi:hypothetical protein
MIDKFTPGTLVVPTLIGVRNHENYSCYLNPKDILAVRRQIITDDIHADQMYFLLFSFRTNKDIGMYSVEFEHLREDY